MAYQCCSPWYKIALSICCCFGALVIYMHIDIALEGYGRTPTMAKEKWDAFYGPNAPGRFSHPEVDEQMDFLYQVLFVRLNISYSLSNGILLASLRHPNNCFPPYSNDVDIEITRSGGKLIETIAEAGTSHPLNRDGAIMLTRDMTPHTFSSPTCVKQATAALPQCGTPYPHLKIIVRARTHQYEPFVRNCKGQRVSPIVREEDLVRVDYQCDRCSWFGPIARVVGPQGSFRFSRTGDVVANNGMYTDIAESEHADTSFPETKMVQCNGIPARQWADDTYAAQIMEHSYGADYNEPLCVWWYFKWTCRKIPGMATVDVWGHLWLIKVVVEAFNPIMCYVVLPTVNGYAKLIAVCNFALLLLLIVVFVLCATYKLVRIMIPKMKNRPVYHTISTESGSPACQPVGLEEFELGFPNDEFSP